MEIYVNDELHDLSPYNTMERRIKFKQWYDEKAVIRCGCKSLEETPFLHIRSRTKKDNTVNYFLSRNRGSKINPEKNRKHLFTCPNSSEQEDAKGQLGITEIEDGTSECTLTFGQTNSSSTGPSAGISGLESTTPDETSKSKTKSSLQSLFFALLQKEEAHIDVYHPNENRNLSGRIYSAAKKMKVNKNLLVSNIEKRIYIASSYKGKIPQYSNKIDNPNAPYLIIGWGKREDNFIEEKNKIHIPLYSVDDRNTQNTPITQVKVFKSQFQKAKERIHHLQKYNAVEYGYWVIWRSKTKSQTGGHYYFLENEILFIPADTLTGIPVDSRYEKLMLQRLISEGRHFKKPLLPISFESETLIRPDFVLIDRVPQTIIEVAGLQTDEYLKQLSYKKDYYLKEKFKYVEWKPYELALGDINIDKSDF
ncbi:hypothetical protein [Peribacillus muralis]|uniref:hypothetical protein n=1 Tax=Peribacillus muralis TaxID=264697 RepID=UPI003672079B